MQQCLSKHIESQPLTLKELTAPPPEPEWLKLINQFLAERNTDPEWQYVRCQDKRGALLAWDDPARSGDCWLAPTIQPTEAGFDMDVVIHFRKAEVGIYFSCSKGSNSNDSSLTMAITPDWLDRMRAVLWPK